MDPLRIVLLVHVAAGFVGLVAAVPATRAAKRRGLHTRAGRVFAVCGLVVAASALLLVIPRPTELIGLAVLGVLTGVWSAAGWWMAARKPRVPGGWRLWHIQMMGSAVIAFTTAFAVTMTDGHLVAWVLPTILGSVVIARATARHTRPRHPVRV
ncbi:MAG TPA: hypothetical protein VMM13_08960 [Euzebya sp.]|nr:hypothetical protein [Euzebya sp.]